MSSALVINRVYPPLIQKIPLLLKQEWHNSHTSQSVHIEKLTLTLPSIATLSYVSSVGALLYSGVLFDGDRNSHFLMIERNEAPKGTIAFPAGRVERGESPHEAISREVEEEVGLKISSSSFQPIYYSPLSFKPRHRKPFGRRIIYASQVNAKLLHSLAAWEQKLTPVNVKDAPHWDSYYFSGVPQSPNPEVKSLLLFTHYMLLHFAQLDGVSFLPEAAPQGFYKDEIIRSVSRWVWKQYKARS